MVKFNSGILEGKLYARAVQRWARAARRASLADLATLRRQRTRARLLRAQLDQLIHTADERLALPVVGATGFPKPHNADWAWRPELWRGPLAGPGIAAVETKSMLGNEATLFHDCSRSELSLRQLRNTRESDLAPYGLQMDVFKFDGSFLSLVIDLPQEAAAGLKRRHIIRMDSIVQMEHPLDIFARLNIRHGPNTEQVVRELPTGAEQASIEFDLAYTKLNEKRIERAWIDLIFEGPNMNQVVLRDLTFSRRPRAQI
ncbi:hypothetical protein HTT03_15715 [Sulfitobacter sp. S0837]|uniref:DUF6478 family protein n=1 Tax=Sulfitobacter maritimus TaxID=2741719 RepID=UPI0015823A93|nr:DUF6478 family protein [Sulfitobacter maritimus]NUH66729.1 hypothetical protein [Sulfitobacter maritimus]